jgi:ATP-dependent Lhr-like helicase
MIGTLAAFKRLDPKIQQWIWTQGWTELRDLQEQAVEPILRGDTDVIIAASTASGKTEAAFLPIASSFASNPETPGLALYVSPLKALINDQHRRLKPLFEHVDLPTFPWHGDVSSAVKQRFRGEGRGLLLITPESLEALFVLCGHQIPYFFRNLRYVIVDELHSFIGMERGKQLQSLLHRLETAIDRQVPRIGLSATLGEMRLAAQYLRPSAPEFVHVINSDAHGLELKLLIRGYEDLPSENVDSAELEKDEQQKGTSQRRIAEDLYTVLSGSSNLVFANSRQQVENYADMLRARCEQDRISNTFWPHHGSLSKEIRHGVEEKLKDQSLPITAVCTSTLELGIDIGSVQCVAQINSPFSVASLRQRLGRSGRRGEPAILRVYIEEGCIDDKLAPVEALRPELVQSVALIQLLLAKWCEPPEPEALHLSTLVHQVLSVIAERNGVLPSLVWKLLCKKGPFTRVNAQQFTDLLRALGQTDLIIQIDDGTLLLGPAGERIVNQYSFYTVFQTPREYRLVGESGNTLGSLPLKYAIVENSLLVFAGQRWRVLQVDRNKNVIQVRKDRHGNVPRFAGTGGKIHDRVRQEMRSIYGATAGFPYLDSQAAEFLLQGREQFCRLGLKDRQIIESGGDSYLFLWMGDRVMNTVALQLQSLGMRVANHGIALEVSGIKPDELGERLEGMVESGPADAIRLARSVPNKRTEKFHVFLSEDLLCADYASSMLDTIGAWHVLAVATGQSVKNNHPQPSAPTE